MLRHLVTTTVAAALLAPAAAQASVASVESGVTTWRGTAAAEEIYVYAPYDRPGIVQISGPTVTAGPGCTPYTLPGTSEQGAECPEGTRWRLDAGAGDDHIVLMSAPQDRPDASLVQVDLGDGADVLEADGGSATVRGGDGADVLEGTRYDSSDGTADDFDGGPGNDTLIGGFGDDRLSGGEGDDTLVGDGALQRRGRDRIDGGPGTDLLRDYVPVGAAARATATVTFDTGADDGFPGEGDEVVGVEELISYAAVDFTGGAGGDAASFSSQEDRIEPAGPSTFRGLAGPDRLTGSPRADRLDGGPGPDVLDGAGGDDVIEARDGEADEVRCGAGTDRAVVDAIDRVAPDCESVERPAPVPAAPAPAPPAPPTPAPGGGGAAPGAGSPAAQASSSPRVTLATRTRLGVALAKGLRFRVSGPFGRTVTVQVRRGRTLVATGRGRIGAGGGVTVLARFTPAARKALRRAATARLTVTAGDARTTVTLRR